MDLDLQRKGKSAVIKTSTRQVSVALVCCYGYRYCIGPRSV